MKYTIVQQFRFFCSPKMDVKGYHSLHKGPYLGTQLLTGTFSVSICRKSGIPDLVRILTKVPKLVQNWALGPDLSLGCPRYRVAGVGWLSCTAGKSIRALVERVSKVNLGPLGSTWVYLGLHGSTWVYLGLLGSTWVNLGQLGSTWVYLRLPGSTWIYLGLLGSTWVHLGLLWSIWVFLGLLGSTWVNLGLLGSTWVYLGPLGSTWVYLVHLSLFQITIEWFRTLRPIRGGVNKKLSEKL